ncbi:MAG: hypothetical protein CUN55_18785 [Phototrophicales bacterium]|nr:MAG: hypothetical protein CUN55_18785 [Phototrophicales bacterium]
MMSGTLNISLFIMINSVSFWWRSSCGSINTQTMRTDVLAVIHNGQKTRRETEKLEDDEFQSKTSMNAESSALTPMVRGRRKTLSAHS